MVPIQDKSVIGVCLSVLNNIHQIFLKTRENAAVVSAMNIDNTGVFTITYHFYYALDLSSWMNRG